MTTLDYGICSQQPPSEAHFWIEFGPGHFVHYLDIQKTIDEWRRWRAEQALDAIEVGQTLDMFMEAV